MKNKCRTHERWSLNEALEILTRLTSEEQKVNSITNRLQLTKIRGKRVWIVGNGGSACTASHMASDLMNLGFDVVCLVDNPSRISAITNDYGWEFAYTKQMTHFQKEDILFVLSVHGGGQVGEDWSGNLLLAAIEANKRGGQVVSLIGGDGGRLKENSNYYLIVPDESCCYVEGFHSLVCHILCEKLKGFGR